MNHGSIRTIHDLIVHVEFDDSGPDTGEILLADNEARSPLLVESLQEGNVAICLNLLDDKTLQKNMTVQRTGRGIEVPVGQPTIGRIFNALGQPLDGLKPLEGYDIKRKD